MNRDLWPFSFKALYSSVGIQMLNDQQKEVKTLECESKQANKHLNTSLIVDVFKCTSIADIGFAVIYTLTDTFN